MLYRVYENQSKQARDTLDPIRKLRQAFADLEAQYEKVVQGQDHPFGTLTVRTDNTSGQITLNAGHGIVTGQLFDLFWSGGARSGCIAGAVSGNNVPFSGGTGDNLPAQDTAVDTTHYKTVASEVKIVDASGTPSPNDAYGLAMELASMLGSAGPSLKQLAARIVNYNAQ